MLSRVNVSRFGGLLRPVEYQRVGPECLTCLKPIPKMELVEHGPGDGKPFARVLMRCHGAEQLVTLDMGSAEWTAEELGKLINKQRWFDPHQTASVTEER